MREDISASDIRRNFIKGKKRGIFYLNKPGAGIHGPGRRLSVSAIGAFKSCSAIQIFPEKLHSA
jgi:hypothetical protein